MGKSTRHLESIWPTNAGYLGQGQGFQQEHEVMGESRSLAGRLLVEGLAHGWKLDLGALEKKPATGM